MKLYYAPGACSRATHIVLRETGANVELVQVDIRAHKLVATGEDYYAINPKGYVPALELDSGKLLTENLAILEYLGDQTGLLAKTGDAARYHTIEWLAFISSELHKTFSPFFHPTMPDAAKALFQEKLQARFALLDQHLASNDYLAGDFGLADAYAFTVLSWTAPLNIDISRHTHLSAYMARLAERDSIKAAIAAEG